MPKQGYPDCGNGFYSDKLSYKEWFQFNLDQRAHRNYLEQLPIVVFAIAVSGLVYPVSTQVLGAIYLICRQFYAWGYQANPSARLIASKLQNFSLIGLMGLSIYSACVL